MTKLIIKCRDEMGEKTGESFTFNSDTWPVIGETGTGREGHYSQQGYRKLYASPKPSAKIGRHRFVLHGTGYYPTIEGGSIGNGGLSWGTEAREVDEQEAASIMDAEHLATYCEPPEDLEECA